MPRKVNVVTTSGFPEGAPADENWARALGFMDEAARLEADLVCLPEGFLGRTVLSALEPLHGPTQELLAAKARQHGFWLVAGLYVSDEAGSGTSLNCALVIDRQGDLAGCYTKVHPTIDECGSGVVPGTDPVVVSTDFGRVGLAICYDIGWPCHWSDLARLGAELVVWPSAYDGGYPLRHYAWAHRYHVVSSVRTEHGKVIDTAGHVVAATSSWQPLANAVIDLEQELFHADYNEERLATLQAEMGSRVTLRSFDEERYFTLESNDPEWPLARVKAHYGLEGFADYHERATRVQQEHRAGARLALAGLQGQKG